MLTKAEIQDDMKHMRYERVSQKLYADIDELQDKIEGRQMPIGAMRGVGPGLRGAPHKEAMSLNAWVDTIHKLLDKRATLIKQLEFYETEHEENWVKLWDRLNKELP